MGESGRVDLQDFATIEKGVVISQIFDVDDIIENYDAGEDDGGRSRRIR